MWIPFVASRAWGDAIRSAKSPRPRGWSRCAVFAVLALVASCDACTFAARAPLEAPEYVEQAPDSAALAVAAEPVPITALLGTPESYFGGLLEVRNGYCSVDEQRLARLYEAPESVGRADESVALLNMTPTDLAVCSGPAVVTGEFERSPTPEEGRGLLIVYLIE